MEVEVKRRPGHADSNAASSRAASSGSTIAFFDTHSFTNREETGHTNGTKRNADDSVENSSMEADVKRRPGHTGNNAAV